MKFRKQTMQSCAVLAYLLLCAACGRIPMTGRVPVTGRVQLAFHYPILPADPDEQLTTSKRQGLLARDHAQLARLRWIDRRLRPAVAHYDRNRKATGFTIHLSTNELPNAFAQREGHRVFVTQGLLAMHLTDAELAAVLAHEIGHLVANHIDERATLLDIKAMFVGFRMDEKPGNPFTALCEALVKIPAELFYLYPLERVQESEADEIGLYIMARAGYNPHAMASFFRKITRINHNSRVFALLSNHPADADRIARINQLMPKVMPIYLRFARRP